MEMLCKINTTTAHINMIGIKDRSIIITILIISFHTPPTSIHPILYTNTPSLYAHTYSPPPLPPNTHTYIHMCTHLHITKRLTYC